MRLRPGMWSPVSLRGDSRPSRGSAALTFPTSSFSTERVGGPHAWSQMPVRLRRRCRAEEDRCPVFVSRAANAGGYDSTCTESHGVRRATVAVARRTCAQRACRVWCDCTLQSGRALVRRPGSTEPAPLLELICAVWSVCRFVRRAGVGASRRHARAGAKRARCDV